MCSQPFLFKKQGIDLQVAIYIYICVYVCMYVYISTQCTDKHPCVYILSDVFAAVSVAAGEGEPEVYPGLTRI